MNKEYSKIDFRDFPVSEKDDKLDFRTFAKEISEFIKQLKTPFCMGIYGGWGTGKTTLMKFTKNILAKDDLVSTIWFDSWKYEKYCNLLFPLICEIEKQSPNSKKTAHSFVGETIVPGILDVSNQVIEYGSKRFLGEKVDFKKLYGNLKNRLSFETRENFERQRNIEEEFKKTIEKLFQEKEKVIIFIDDLDRCLPEKVIELLESIKLYLMKEKNKTIYVLGLDDKIISSAISEKYGNLKDNDINNYLDKMIQFNIRLPMRNAFKLIEYLVKSNINLVKDKGLLRRRKMIADTIYQVLYVEIRCSNPRKIKRIIFQLFFILSKNLRKNLIPKELDDVDYDKKHQLLRKFPNILLYYLIILFFKEYYHDFYYSLVKEDYSAIITNYKLIKIYNKFKMIPRKEEDFKKVTKEDNINYDTFESFLELDKKMNYIEEIEFRRLLLGFKDKLDKDLPFEKIRDAMEEDNDSVYNSNTISLRRRFVKHVIKICEYYF